MPTKLKDMLSGAIAAVSLGAFAVMYWVPMLNLWFNGFDPLCKPTDEYVTVATTLAGLVGGVVAYLFGQQLPAPGATTATATVRDRLRLLLGAEPGQEWRVLAALVYTVVYVLTVFAALGSWVGYSNSAGKLDLLKNLGLIGLGLMVAIARGFFNFSKQG
ncbi:MAG TPA: hypothetical protein VKE74_12925 [Gemmataceae bacterium]|nr:hypothetical protein [Gemmataceae bacterium]